jgi:curved DNA-binding protein CbpA
MILLEVNDEALVSFYEVLGLSPAGKEELDKSTVRKAAKELKKHHQRPALAGDEEAREKLALINQAELTLGDPEKRKKHDEELESGRGAALEILRVQRIASPFFWDRNVRLRIIERLMREAGLVQPIPLDLEGARA